MILRTSRAYGKIAARLPVPPASYLGTLLQYLIMPSNKKHHFVPRFYLRNFSSNGRSINIFNIKSERSITNANVDNQCFRNYYYGKDVSSNTGLTGTEKGLSVIESEASAVFRGIMKTHLLPGESSPERLMLFLYLLTQRERTPYSVDMHDRMMNDFLKLLVSKQLDNTYDSEDLDQ